MRAILARHAALSLDGPGAHALMERIVAGEVTVLDEAVELVAATERDLFVLAHDERIGNWNA